MYRLYKQRAGWGGGERGRWGGAGSSWWGRLPVSRLLPPQSAHTGGCSASLAVVDGLNEFHGGGELHPPIALHPAQPAGVEIIDVLNGGQQAGRVCLEGRRCGDGPALNAEKNPCSAIQSRIINMEIWKVQNVLMPLNQERLTKLSQGFQKVRNARLLVSSVINFIYSIYLYLILFGTCKTCVTC